jgi:hypothetical protein
MKWATSWHVRSRKEMHVDFLWRNLKKRYHLEDLSINWRIMWTEEIWVRIWKIYELF